MPCLPVQPPASALGSLPSVALSSVRVSTILTVGSDNGPHYPGVLTSPVALKTEQVKVVSGRAREVFAGLRERHIV